MTGWNSRFFAVLPALEHPIFSAGNYLFPRKEAMLEQRQVQKRWLANAAKLYPTRRMALPVDRCLRHYCGGTSHFFLDGRWHEDRCL